MGELLDAYDPGTSVVVFLSRSAGQANQRGHINYPATGLPTSAASQLPAALSKSAAVTEFTFVLAPGAPHSLGEVLAAMSTHFHAWNAAAQGCRGVHVSDTAALKSSVSDRHPE